MEIERTTCNQTNRFRLLIAVFAALICLPFLQPLAAFAADSAPDGGVVKLKWDSFRWGTESLPDPDESQWQPFEQLDRILMYKHSDPGENPSLWLETTLPGAAGANPQLLIEETSAVLHLEFYLDGQRIFVPDENRIPVGLHKWDMISFKPEYAGHRLDVRLYPGKTTTYEFGVWAGSERGLILKLLQDDTPFAVLGIVLLLFGLSAFILFIRFREEKIYVPFAVYTVSGAVRFLLWGGSWQLWTDPAWFKAIGYFAHMNGYVNYASYIFLLEAVIGPGKFKVVRRCAQAMLAFGAAEAVARLWKGSAVDDFFYYVFYYYLAVIVMFVLLAVMLRTLRSRNNAETKLLTVGFLAVMVTEAFVFGGYLLIPVRLAQTSPALYSAVSIGWNHYGMLVFVLCIGAILLRRMAEVSRRVNAYALELKEKNEQLLQMDRLKDEFLANTSHELRTPLHGIIGIAESLMDGAAGAVAKPVASNLQLVLASARRLANLINDILDFSRLKHRDIDIRRISVDIHMLADMILALSRPFIHGKDIALVNAVPPHTYVEGDPDRIQQILQNLVGNAAKFTREGKVEVSAGTGERSDGMIEICVSDTGIGISADKLERIFASFEQADGSTEREYGGTGLGLTITRQLVELHGGEIRAESEPGRGARFRFTLPLAAVPGREATAEDARIAGVVDAASERGTERSDAIGGEDSIMMEEESANAAGEEDRPANSDRPVILVVDDDPVNLRVLANHLRLLRCAVRQAGSGPEALDMIETGFMPDLILLDVMMPRMSGYEMCMRLRERHSVSELPVILLTGKDRVQDLVHGFEAGANDYLTKPVSKQELLSRIGLHLKVAKWHAMLEHQVRERTAELADANSELEQAYRTLSEMEQSRRMLFGNISHELRTPLTSIQGYVKGMLDGIERFQDRKYLQRIYEKTVYLHRIIRDLFELSKLEAKQIRFEYQRLELLPFLQSLSRKYGPDVEMRGYRFASALPDPESFGPASVRVDPLRIEQVLTNFVDNAMKFTGEGGTIRLFAHFEEKSETAGRVRIGIQDTGVGISEEDLPHVFDRFYRAPASRESRSEGAGLGLSICREILRYHGGDVGASSTFGEGSTFYLTLPVHIARSDSREVV